jgi:hypothetical protein
LTLRIDGCGFEDAIASLERSPDRCPIARENERFPYELRELLYGSGRRKTHRALIRIVGNRVEVMAIRHLAQREFRPDDLRNESESGDAYDDRRD